MDNFDFPDNTIKAQTYQYQNLAQGTTLFKGQRAWYYGLKAELDGRKIIYVILSNGQVLCDSKKDVSGKIINQIKDNSINYRSDIISLGIQSWSIDAINYFVPDGNMTPKSSLELYLTIKKNIDYYMDLKDPLDLDIISLFVIMTYCFQLFESVPYLYLVADISSGKTTLSNLIANLSFNSVDASNASRASLFRVVEGNSPLLIIDDYMDLNKETMQDINHLMKVGYKKGAIAIRMDESSKNKDVNVFSVYCPKVITNTLSLDKAIESRSFIIRLTRSFSDKGRKKKDFDNPKWQSIRDDISLWVMKNWQEVETTYKTLEANELSARDFEISLPILTLAKMVSDELYQSVKEHIIELVKDRDVIVDYKKDWVYLLFDSCKEIITDSNEGWHYASKIYERFNLQMLEQFGKNTYSINLIGRKLKNSTLQAIRDEKGQKYYLSIRDINENLIRLGYPTYPTEPTSNENVSNVRNV